MAVSLSVVVFADFSRVRAPLRCRWAIVIGTLVLSVLGVSARGLAQELPLKRQIPGADVSVCPSMQPGSEPSPDDRAEAARLGSSAGEALILGDREGARGFLERATTLDPGSPSLAYDHGRILEGLGDRRAARLQYCRVLALDSGSADAVDVQRRLDGFVEDERRAVPVEAVNALQAGLTDADSGQLQSALDRFNQAVGAAPTWADAFFDRGVVHARLDLRDEALSDLRRYLELAPEADDLAEVSEWIGQLQSLGSLPSPGGAFALGIFIPGMGQFYSGRPLAGFTYLTLAGAGVAAAFLIEEIEVRCLSRPPEGEPCPPSQIQEEIRSKPYKWAGLGAFAGVTLIAAIEALVKARGRRRAEASDAFSLNLGGARLLPPSVVRRGKQTDLRLVRIRF